MQAYRSSDIRKFNGTNVVPNTVRGGVKRMRKIVRAVPFLVEQSVPVPSTAQATAERFLTHSLSLTPIEFRWLPSHTVPVILLQESSKFC